MSEEKPIYHVNYSGHVPANTTCSIIPLSDNVSVSFVTHPEHDGNLEGRNPYTVQHMFGLLMPSVASVKIGHEEVSNDEVWLSPKQALSLLEWLTQEKATLEQLAKEAQ